MVEPNVFNQPCGNLGVCHWGDCLRCRLACPQPSQSSFSGPPGGNILQGLSHSHEVHFKITYKTRLTWRWNNIIWPGTFSNVLSWLKNRAHYLRQRRELASVSFTSIDMRRTFSGTWQKLPIVVGVSKLNRIFSISTMWEARGLPSGTIGIGGVGMSTPNQVVHPCKEAAFFNVPLILVIPFRSYI